MRATADLSNPRARSECVRGASGSEPQRDPSTRRPSVRPSIHHPPTHCPFTRSFRKHRLHAHVPAAGFRGAHPRSRWGCTTRLSGTLPGPRGRAQAPSGGGEEAPARPAESVSHLTLRGEPRRARSLTSPASRCQRGGLRGGDRRSLKAMLTSHCFSLSLFLSRASVGACQKEKTK